MKRIVLLISMLVMTQVFSQQVIKDLTVNKFKVVNTKMGSNPCPLMSELDRDAIASPTDGQCIYNTTSKKLNIYNDLALVWKAAGGGVDAWATGFAYSADDLVIESDKIYKALTAHTSGVFATDLANGDWVEISQGVTDHTALTNIGTNTHAQIDTHIANNSNPHAVTKAQIGLGSVVDSDTTTTSNISDSTNKRFVTDANITTIGNQSGVNTGDLLTKSHIDSSSVVTTELQTPNGQLTTTDTNKRRIETGNGNLLSNPSFEAGTYNSGWACSLGSTTLETSAVTDGKKALGLNSIGAGVRCYQTSTTNAANLKGLLGSAIVKIKTTDSIYKVCGLVDGNAAANERNCITVSPTSTDLPFYPARTDFYMGGTSNGIVVYTTTTTSQPTVIDDAFVGVFNGGLSQFSNNTGWSDCGLVAADFVGLGTPTAIQLQCKRDTTDLLVKGKFTAGTVSATEARVNLKLNGVSLSSSGSTIIPSIQKAGDYGFNVVGATYGVMLIEPSVGYLTFGVQNSANASLNKVNGTVIGTSTITTLDARVPIAGWEANTNAAIAGCVDAFGCTETFSAKVSSSGVISGENVKGWLTSCSYSSGNVCAFKSGLFTVTPNCWMGNFTTGASQSSVNGWQIYNASTSGATFASIDAAGASFTAKNQTVYCQKNEADFKPKTVVVSPLQGYVKVPGAENLTVENFTVSYGATATTPCAVNGACAYKDELGTNAVLNTTRTGAGAYTLNTVATYSKLKCRYPLVTTGGYTIVYSANNLSCSNCSSVSFTTAVYNTGVSTDSYGTLDCTGVR